MNRNSMQTTNIDYEINQIVQAPQGWYAKVVNGTDEENHPIICWGLILVKRHGLKKKSVVGFVYQKDKQILPAIAVKGFEQYVYEPDKKDNDFSLTLSNRNDFKDDNFDKNGSPVPEIDPKKLRASYELYANILSKPADPTNCFSELVKELDALDATDAILSESEIEAFNYRILMIEEFDIMVADNVVWIAIATLPFNYGKFPSREEFFRYVEQIASGA